MAEIGLVREGHIFEDSVEVDALKEQIRELRRELRQAENTAAQAKGAAMRATAELRRQLSPLYKALQAVFGELDELGADDAVTQPDSRTAAVWASWKSKFPGKPAMIIDALLLHGSLNTSQIAIAIGSDRSNVPPMISKLKTAGLLDKNGNNFSLKKL